MAKSSIIRVRVDSEHQQRAESILAELGVTPGQAIGMMYAQIIQQRGLPFAVALAKLPAHSAAPNNQTASTWAALDDQDYSALVAK